MYSQIAIANPSSLDAVLISRFYAPLSSSAPSGVHVRSTVQSGTSNTRFSPAVRKHSRRLPPKPLGLPRLAVSPRPTLLPTAGGDIWRVFTDSKAPQSARIVPRIPLMYQHKRLVMIKRKASKQCRPSRHGPILRGGLIPSDSGGTCVQRVPLLL